MTRELPKDEEGTEYVQFRGAQTSVTLDEYPVVFEMETREVDGDEIQFHAPYPVIGPDGAMSEDRAAEKDTVGIWHELAETLTTGNPLIAYGIACELCDDVFETPKGLGSHLRVHESETDDESATDKSTDDTESTNEEES